MANSYQAATAGRATVASAGDIASTRFGRARDTSQTDSPLDWWRASAEKLVRMCSAKKNWLQKVLVYAGIRPNVLVSDIHGISARAMV